MKRNKDLTNGSVFFGILTFALPIILTSVIQQLYNTADTIIVGQFGGDTALEREISIAAVGACGGIIALFINFFIGMSSGSGILVSHAVGAKNYDSLGNIIHTSIITAGVCGIFISAVGIIFARPLLIMVSTPDSVIEHAILYMRAFFLGVPAQFIFNYCAAILRSSGNSTTPLVILSISGISNVILNVITVAVFGMGALGVGIATAASNWISFIMVIVYMARSSGLCKFSLKELRVNFDTLKKILGFGIPTGISSSMFSIGNVVVQSAFNSLGSTVYMSGSSVADNVIIYSALTGNGIVQAAQIFVGQNLGAGRMDRIKSGVKHGLLLSLGAIAITVSIVLIFQNPIFELFAPGNYDVIEFAKMKTLIILPMYIFGITNEFFAACMSGMGDTKTPMTVSIICVCGIRIVWIYTVFAMFRNPYVLFAVYGISWLISSIGQFIFYVRTRRKVEQSLLTNNALV